MSVTLATVADALIEFILSLLRDPDTAAEFDADPEGTMASRGLSSVRAEDVCAVAPIVVERAAVVHSAPASTPVPQATPRNVEPNPVLREIQNITNNFAWVDDRDTVVDQSVNQNIWADGDVTQTFDQEAVVATGEDSIAAGDDVDIDQTEDNSTTITAAGDANVGNETTSTVVDSSFNEATDASTTTDSSTDIQVEEALNDSSTTTTTTDSDNSSAVEYTETNVDVEANTAFESTDTVIIEDTGADDEF
ncbi:MAG TPA: IniB N-terminal domain-containing protein [Microbacterium sp.]|uniref:IniB N-terminal domain-containing protein n=1 Tax=Microbacterium sp. TaxID=51671 RepID=UPI002C404AB3|nr:IniB N-terminal domain-containing protein [Microbacterium sp.]HWI31683.1 IniB N-terminal domain-containing protein [Microbacterium sp.]